MKQATILGYPLRTLLIIVAVGTALSFLYAPEQPTAPARRPAAGQEYILTTAQHLRTRPVARPITGPLLLAGTRVTATGPLTTHWREVRTATGQTGWLLRSNTRVVPPVASPLAPPATATPVPAYAVRITSDLPHATTEYQPLTVHLTLTNLGRPLPHMVLESNLSIDYWATPDDNEFSLDSDCPGGPTPSAFWASSYNTLYVFGALAHGQTCHITVRTVGFIFIPNTCYQEPVPIGFNVYSLDTVNFATFAGDTYLVDADGSYASAYDDNNVHRVDGALDQQVTIRCRSHG